MTGMKRRDFLTTGAAATLGGCGPLREDEHKAVMLVTPSGGELEFRPEDTYVAEYVILTPKFGKLDLPFERVQKDVMIHASLLKDSKVSFPGLTKEDKVPDDMMKIHFEPDAPGSGTSGDIFIERRGDICGMHSLSVVDDNGKPVKTIYTDSVTTRTEWEATFMELKRAAGAVKSEVKLDGPVQLYRGEGGY